MNMCLSLGRWDHSLTFPSTQLLLNALVFSVWLPNEEKKNEKGWLAQALQIPWKSLNPEMEGLATMKKGTMIIVTCPFIWTSVNKSSNQKSGYRSQYLGTGSFSSTLAPAGCVQVAPGTGAQLPAPWLGMEDG